MTIKLELGNRSYVNINDSPTHRWNRNGVTYQTVLGYIQNGTKSFDLIWKGVEIGTGAQREHRYEILKKQAQEKNIDLDSLESYAEIFKFGSIPHGGVGLGLDRMTQRLLNLENIREAILLPRDPERLQP